MSRAHIKLDRPWSSTLFLFESHENMERVCSSAFWEYGSPPFYSRVNVYEFVNKQAGRDVVTFAIWDSKKLGTEVPSAKRNLLSLIIQSGLFRRNKK